jgi:hydrogenase maturation protease
VETGAPLVRVLGLGNVLMGDDALGPWVIHRLEATHAFPPEVEFVDVGTPGLDLVPYVTGPCGIILVDTVHSKGAEPGDIRTYDRDALVKFGPKPRLSPHDPGVTEAILAVEMAGTPPAFVTLVGVVPGSVQAGVGLTPALQRAVVRAADTIVAELVARGFAVRPRSADTAPVPIPWWEAPASGSSPVPEPPRA